MAALHTHAQPNPAGEGTPPRAYLQEPFGAAGTHRDRRVKGLMASGRRQPTGWRGVTQLHPSSLGRSQGLWFPRLENPSHPFFQAPFAGSGRPTTQTQRLQASSTARGTVAARGSPIAWRGGSARGPFRGLSVFSRSPGSVCAHVAAAPAAAVGGVRMRAHEGSPSGGRSVPWGSVPVAWDCAHLPTRSGAVRMVVVGGCWCELCTRFFLCCVWLPRACAGVSVPSALRCAGCVLSDPPVPHI